MAKKKSFENYFKKNQLSLVGRVIKSKKIIFQMNSKDQFEIDIKSLDKSYKKELYS